MVNQGIQQQVRYAIRRSGGTRDFIAAHFLDLVHDLKRDGVSSDQEVFAKKKVKFARRKSTIFAIVIHRVHDNEQMRRKFIIFARDVLFDFWSGIRRQAIFDCKRMAYGGFKTLVKR